LARKINADTQLASAAVTSRTNIVQRTAINARNMAPITNSETYRTAKKPYISTKDSRNAIEFSSAILPSPQMLVERLRWVSEGAEAVEGEGGRGNGQGRG